MKKVVKELGKSCKIFLNHIELLQILTLNVLIVSDKKLFLAIITQLICYSFSTAKFYSFIIYLHR